MWKGNLRKGLEMVSLKETKIRSKKRGEKELKRLSVEEILRREIPEEE